MYEFICVDRNAYYVCSVRPQIVGKCVYDEIKQDCLAQAQMDWVLKTSKETRQVSDDLWKYCSRYATT